MLPQRFFLSFMLQYVQMLDTALAMQVSVDASGKLLTMPAALMEDGNGLRNIPSMDFGGSSSKDVDTLDETTDQKRTDTGEKAVKVLKRPSYLHGLKCSAAARGSGNNWQDMTQCSECEGESGCWNGIDATFTYMGLVRKIDNTGFLEIKLDSSQTTVHKYFIAEVYMKCIGHTTQLQLHCSKLENAAIEFYADDHRILPKSPLSPPLTNRPPACEGCPPMPPFYNLALKLPSDFEGMARLVLTVKEQGKPAYGMMRLAAEDVAEITDLCMEKSNCLKVVGEELGDKKERGAAISLRSDQVTQYKCLSHDVGLMSEALKKVCKEWEACLDNSAVVSDGKLRAKRKQVLLQFLKVSTGAFQAPRTTTATTTKASACLDKTPQFRKCSTYKRRQSGLFCAMGKNGGVVRRRNFGGDAKDNCKSTCGYCEQASSVETTSTVKSYCFNPAVGDPEGLECNCVETVMKFCNVINLDFNDQCVFTYLCKQPEVCQTWKDSNNCPAAASGSLLELSSNVSETYQRGTQLKQKDADGSKTISSLLQARRSDGVSRHLLNSRNANSMKDLDGTITQKKCQR